MKAYRIKLFRSILAISLILVMLVAMLPERMIQHVGLQTDVEAATILANPRIVADASMEHSKQKVTWDCIWFGSYPQTEISDNRNHDGSYNVTKYWPDQSDCELNPSLYKLLQKADYDSNGDTVIGGVKYKRVRKEEATYVLNSISKTYYYWENGIPYHYFRYEPIKWRVLSVNGKDAFLLSDKALDNKNYIYDRKMFYWEKSLIRSWLNGYDASANKDGFDYSKKNFISSAFTPAERAAIFDTQVENKYNLEYGTDGGNNTTDKVYLLSESELYTDQAVPYGFVADQSVRDEARKMRSTAYARAMGLYSNEQSEFQGNCDWWSRSIGNGVFSAVQVSYIGTVNNKGISAYVNASPYTKSISGICPALHLNLAASNLWTYAGTVSSDGSKEESGGIRLNKTSLYVQAGKTYALQATSENSVDTHLNLSWSSSDESIATVSSSGIVKGVKPGKVVISAKSTQNSNVASCQVTVGFSDVKEDDWYKPSVVWAVDKRIANGTSDTTFSPNNTCTRAQIVTFFWNRAHQPIVHGVENPFTDVKETDWYYQAVLWAVKNKITNGTSPTTFSPNKICTRGQVITFLWNSSNKPMLIDEEVPFTDVSEDAYYYRAVQWAVWAKATQGTSPTTFSPDKYCTRAEVVTFLYNWDIKYYNY